MQRMFHRCLLNTCFHICQTLFHAFRLVHSHRLISHFFVKKMRFHFWSLRQSSKLFLRLKKDTIYQKVTSIFVDIVKDGAFSSPSHNDFLEEVSLRGSESELRVINHYVLTTICVCIYVCPNKYLFGSRNFYFMKIGILENYTLKHNL